MRKPLLPLLLLAALLSACPDESTPEPHTESDAAVSGAEVGEGGIAAASTDAGDAVRASPSATHDSSSPAADASGGDAGPSPQDVASLNTDYKAWQASLEKLRGCGLLDLGVWLFDPGFDLRCESLCVLAASCADLKADVCNDVPVKSLEDCLDLCTSEDISCGDGSKVPADYACDLRNDCANGEDEKHCEPFRCKADGRAIGSDYVCDGEADCSDASDEKGCALLCGTPRAMHM